MDAGHTPAVSQPQTPQPPAPAVTIEIPITVVTDGGPADITRTGNTIRVNAAPYGGTDTTYTVHMPAITVHPTR